MKEKCFNNVKTIFALLLAASLIVTSVLFCDMDPVLADTDSETTAIPGTDSETSAIPGTDTEDPADNSFFYAHPAGSVKIAKKAIASAERNIRVNVNGKKLSAKGFTLSGKIDGAKTTFVYVPAKAFTKALGGTYEKNGKNITIELGNDTITAKTSFTVGKDSYSLFADDSALNIGEIAYGCSFGKAVKKDKKVFLPIEVFASLIENDVYNGAIEMKLKGKKLTVAAGDTGSAIREIPILGGYTAAESPSITPELKAVLDKAIDLYDGMEIIPVAYLAHQVVAGTNHKVICRIRPVVSGKEKAVETYGIVTVYQDLKGGAEITNIRDTGVATHISTGIVDGGWGQVDSSMLDSSLLEVAEKALQNLLGVNYKPIAPLASQVVAGMNYCVLCEAKGVYPGATKDYSFVYVFVGLDGTAEITDIIPAGK